MCVSICGCVLMFVFSQLFILTLRVIERHVSICPTFIEDNEAVILRQLHWIGTGPQTAAQGDTHTHTHLPKCAVLQAIPLAPVKHMSNITMYRKRDCVTYVQLAEWQTQIVE